MYKIVKYLSAQENIIFRQYNSTANPTVLTFGEQAELIQMLTSFEKTKFIFVCCVVSMELHPQKRDINTKEAETEGKLNVYLDTWGNTDFWQAQVGCR